MTQTGAYAVSLSPENAVDAAGTATFTAYDVPADVMGTVTAGAAAQSFSLTTPGQGLRASFVGAANQKATFIVTAAKTTPPAPCTNITILEPDGKTILVAAQNCNNNDTYSSGSLTLPSSGNYLVVATPTVPATGVFTVGATSP